MARRVWHRSAFELTFADLSYWRTTRDAFPCLAVCLFALVPPCGPSSLSVAGTTVAWLGARVRIRCRSARRMFRTGCMSGSRRGVQLRGRACSGCSCRPASYFPAVGAVPWPGALCIFPLLALRGCAHDSWCRPLPGSVSCFGAAAWPLVASSGIHSGLARSLSKDTSRCMLHVSRCFAWAW